jgi:hypothetical protein
VGRPALIAVALAFVVAPTAGAGAPKPPCSGFIPIQKSFSIPLPTTGSLTFFTAKLKPGATASAVCNVSANLTGMPAGIRAAAEVGKAAHGSATIVVGINNLATKRVLAGAGGNLDVIVSTSAQVEDVVASTKLDCKAKAQELKSLRNATVFLIDGARVSEAREIVANARKRLPC